MPTYEYECQKCGHEFERFQSMTDAPLKRCPECRGKVVRKIGTGAGLLFKGNGFYITDYRSDNYKKAASADASSGKDKAASKPSGDSKAAGGGAGAKQDAKPSASKATTGKAS